jgi:ribose transport system substrate-binding protein
VSDRLTAHGSDIVGTVTTDDSPAVAVAADVKAANLPIKDVATDDDPKIQGGIKGDDQT